MEKLEVTLKQNVDRIEKLFIQRLQSLQIKKEARAKQNRASRSALVTYSAVRASAQPSSSLSRPIIFHNQALWLCQAMTELLVSAGEKGEKRQH